MIGNPGSLNYQRHTPLTLANPTTNFVLPINPPLQQLSEWRKTKKPCVNLLCTAIWVSSRRSIKDSNYCVKILLEKMDFHGVLGHMISNLSELRVIWIVTVPDHIILKHHEHKDYGQHEIRANLLSMILCYIVTLGWKRGTFAKCNYTFKALFQLADVHFVCEGQTFRLSFDQLWPLSTICGTWLV